MLWLALASVIPLALFAAIAAVQLAKEERSGIEEGTRARVESLLAGVDEHMRGIVVAMQTLAASPSLDAPDLRSFYRHMSEAMKSRPDWLFINLLLPSGEQLVNTERPFGAALPPSPVPDTVRLAARTRTPQVSNMAIRPLEGRYSFGIFVPVIRGGAVRYVLGVVLKPLAISNLLVEQRLPHGWLGAVIDRDSRIVARSLSSEKYVGQSASPGFKELLERSPPEHSTYLVSRDALPLYVVHARSRFSGWEVAVGAPASLVAARARSAVWVLGLGILATMALAVGLSIVFARRIATPIAALAKLGKTLGETGSLRTLPGALQRSTIAEVQALEQSLHETATRLEHAFVERDRVEQGLRKSEEALQRRSTELEAAKTSAEHAKAEADRANRAKDEFLAVLSHELRTPLTSVLLAVNLLQRRAGPDADIGGSLELIRRNVQLQARLIDDLLDVTRIAQGKLVLKREPIDLVAVVDRAVETVRPDIDARRLHFQLTLTGAPYCVEADSSRLQQVIWNLLSNAVKFTPEGGRVQLHCDREDGRVCIEVSDSGLGIDPEGAERIFDAFEQGGRDTTRQFGGLGLGLAIAKRLVEMHQGTISVHSAGRNRGATFRVLLPLSSASPGGQAPQHATPAPGLSKRVLLVEDNADTRSALKMLLETLGHQVEVAADSEQALEAIERGPFDLLLSDLGLPDRSGIELLQELRRRGHAIKAVALSGYGQQEDLQLSKSAGFSAHLIKPVDAEALMETFAAIL